MEFPEGFLRQSSANPDSVTNGGETRQAYSWGQSSSKETVKHAHGDQSSSL